MARTTTVSFSDTIKMGGILSPDLYVSEVFKDIGSLSRLEIVSHTKEIIANSNKHTRNLVIKYIGSQDSRNDSLTEFGMKVSNIFSRSTTDKMIEALKAGNIDNISSGTHSAAICMALYGMISSAENSSKLKEDAIEKKKELEVMLRDLEEYIENKGEVDE